MPAGEAFLPEGIIKVDILKKQNVIFKKKRHVYSSMEGFNNKVGWLQKQAYGYSDLEYFKLKIYDLPKLKP